LGINRIVGYIAAGIVIGPFTPGVFVRTETIENLAELGLVFLLFSLGLSFSFDEMRRAGAVSIAGNVAAMGLLAVGFAGAAVLAGFPHPWILALAAVLSSTAIGAALLRDWGVEDTAGGHLALGILVVQDLFAVILLVVVATPANELSFIGLAIPVVKAIVFVAVALTLGGTLLRRVVVVTLANAPQEAVFGAFATIALFAGFLAYVVGLPFEFGAFMAGAVISEAAGSAKVATAVMPFRALFVSLFFVGVGMLIDPALILRHWPVIIGLGAAFVLFRGIIWSALGKAAGVPWPSLLLFGVALVPLGEFNMVLASTAVLASGINDYERSVLVGITFFSILATTLGAPLFNRVAAAARSR
jgi:monovalent cation:H+ antiporter-2, CPA2 family